MTKKIKLFDPIVDFKEEEIIKKTLKSGFWASGSGTGNVKKFEKNFSKFVNSNESVAVNSGTAALHLALSMINIKNKEVILPSLSFVSTAHAVIYNQGIPVFADVDPSTLNIDLQSIHEKITSKTKAILPVHFGGYPADLKDIHKIAKKNNLLVVEDAAHACGATFEKKRIGGHSPFVCFSFHPVKNLAMPGGGIISINSKNYHRLKEKLDSLRWCGISNRKGVKYDIEKLGWNYYMNEFSASIGLVQLTKLNKLNRIRQKNALQYYKKINLISKMPFNENSVYHFYWILVDEREELRKKLQEKGIETGIHYQPIHKMKMYYNKISLKNTEEVSKKIITLPTHPNLSSQDINRIIKIINEFL